MCIFNDLSGGDCYPTLQIYFEDGKERIIKNVSFYSVNGATVDVYARNKKDPVKCNNVQYVKQTYYKCKMYKGKIKLALK